MYLRGPNVIKKTCWGCGGIGHSWRECSTPRQGNTLPFRPNFLNVNPVRRQNLNGQQGEEDQSSTSPSDNQGAIHIYQELIAAGAQADPDYYNANPWARILGRANETNVEIDGVISKALIYSGAKISIMSKDYCHERGYEIQSLEHLIPIEGSGGANVLIQVM